MNLHPHIKSRFNATQLVMLDVIIALMPVLFAGWLAYGLTFLIQLFTALTAALITEFIFSALFLKRYSSLFDGSAVITAILLVCTLAPLTPWYAVIFGSFSAVLFGKILWGGLGKNRFNPALVGREFMSVFFAVQMTSPALWKSADLVNQQSVNLFPGIASEDIAAYFSEIIFKTNGAMGEYSILAISMGGLYLLLRNRISWHIPLSLLLVWSALCWINGLEGLSYSIAGILFGTIFMATDMPSSPATANGKLFYGAMIGLCIFLFIKGGVRFEYMSFSILLLNGFSHDINMVFSPRPWGEMKNHNKTIEEIFYLVIKIITVLLAVLAAYKQGLISYAIYIYIAYIIFKFNFSFSKSLKKYV